MVPITQIVQRTSGYNYFYQDLNSSVFNNNATDVLFFYPSTSENYGYFYYTGKQAESTIEDGTGPGWIKNQRQSGFTYDNYSYDYEHRWMTTVSDPQFATEFPMHRADTHSNGSGNYMSSSGITAENVFLAQHSGRYCWGFQGSNGVLRSDIDTNKFYTHNLDLGSNKGFWFVIPNYDGTLTNSNT